MNSDMSVGAFQILSDLNEILILTERVTMKINYFSNNENGSIK